MAFVWRQGQLSLFSTARSEWYTCFRETFSCSVSWSLGVTASPGILYGFCAVFLWVINISFCLGNIDGCIKLLGQSSKPAVGYDDVTIQLPKDSMKSVLVAAELYHISACAVMSCTGNHMTLYGDTDVPEFLCIFIADCYSWITVA